MPKVETFQDLVLEPRKDGQEIWRWLYTELRSGIIDGRLKSGARLPSTRNLAAQYGLARGTVVAAFQQLQAEGFVFVRSECWNICRTGARVGDDLSD